MIAVRVVSFKADEELLDLLENYARQRGVPKSEIIRRAIRAYLVTVDDRPFVTRRIKIYS